MLDKKFLQEVFKEYGEFEIGRRRIIRVSSDALHLSKQAIFALHRADIESARGKLASAENALRELSARFAKNKSLRGEGSWKAGVEEFVEAKLFYAFVVGEKIGAVKAISVRPDEYLGGLSDLTGEILRMMVILTTRREMKKVRDAGSAISDIVAELLQTNLTGYLRTKFDQAKKNLQRAEQILYDLSLRDLD